MCIILVAVWSPYLLDRGRGLVGHCDLGGIESAIIKLQHKGEWLASWMPSFSIGLLNSGCVLAVNKMCDVVKNTTGVYPVPNCLYHK